MRDARDIGSFVLMLLATPVFGVVFAVALLVTFPIWLPLWVVRRFRK